MVVAKPRRSPRQLTVCPQGEAAPPQPKPQSAASFEKGKNKEAKKSGSRFSVLTENLEDLEGETDMIEIRAYQGG